MHAKVYSISVIGLEGHLVEVEVDIRPGLFGFNIVGLGNKSVQESKERVISAIRNSGYKMPAKRITVNLAPAGLIKSGTAFDLPIAMGILLATNQINGRVEDEVFWGELALDAKLRGCAGALVVADAVKNLNKQTIFVPSENAYEASVVKGIQIFAPANLTECCTHFEGEALAAESRENISQFNAQKSAMDFKYIVGQTQAKRALEIVAAGGHNILLSGTPGSGKTYMSRCLATIMPQLTFEESIEVTKIHSVSGFLKSDDLISVRPFRAPHHTSSYVALIGGGAIPKPGEISLAHRGVLFLDEFNEFEAKTLETLRQPLEDKLVNIARAAGAVTFPASFTLIAAMNPCKCGYFGDSERDCTCSELELEKYMRKISGPILDRIDLQINVTRIKEYLGSDQPVAESSEVIRRRVEQARVVQAERNGKFGVISNADLEHNSLLDIASIEADAFATLKKAAEVLQLSARGYYRTLKVARTIADLAASIVVNKDHIAEALSYRLTTA